MPNRSVAAGCGNMPSDSVSLFRFPKDPHLCGVWTRQVQRTRANWKPSSASVAEWLRAWDTLTMFEATVCGRS